MKFFTKFFRRREYECYVFLANEHSPRPWETPIWDAIAELLGPVVECGEGDPHINVREWRSRDAKARRERPLKHSRLAWTPRSFSGWTHGANEARLFQHLEVIQPSLGVCEKRNLLPSLYLFVGNESSIVPNPKIPYHAIWCTEQRLFERVNAVDAIPKLTELLDPARIFHKVRPWGYIWGSSTNDTARILDYAAIMPMYDQRLGRPIGPPRHGWTDVISDVTSGA